MIQHLSTPAAPVAVQHPKTDATTARLSSIDGLRAWAAGSVYLYHVWQVSGSPKAPVHLGGTSFDLYFFFSTGTSGVDLFMILSGLCLFLPLLKCPSKIDNFSPAAFFRRRMWRLMPAYYASMVCMTILPVLLVFGFRLLHLKANWQHIDSWWQYVTHILLIHTFFTDTWCGIYGPWWSLGVEAQLYLFFPLAIWLYRRHGFAAFPIMIASSVVYQIVVWSLTHTSPDPWLTFIWSVNLLGRWIEFGLGMGIAWAMVNWSNIKLPIGQTIVRYSLPLAALFYCCACVRFPVPWVPFYLCCMATAYGFFVISACFGNGLLNKLLKTRAFVWIGTISYSVYLLHQCAVWYLSCFCKRFLHLDGHLLMLLMATVGFALTIAISTLFFAAFEKPFLSKAKSA